MKMVLRLVLLAALIALGVWAWTMFFPGPEKAIRQRVVKLAKTVSFTKNQGNFSRIASGERVAGFFSTNVEININVPGHEQNTLVGRDEITRATLRARVGLRELIVTFPDVNVTVAPDKQSAVAEVTVDAEISGEHDAIVQELKITFQKINGDWLITKIETVRTIS